MDKLAEGLQRLNEDDLLMIVQMVHDNKSSDSYTKNDVEREYSPIPYGTCLCLRFPNHQQRASSTLISTPSQTL